MFLEGVSAIVNVSKEFDNVYRVTTESNIVVDIHECGCDIDIDSISKCKLMYAITDDINKNMDDTYSTKMNGIVYKLEKECVYVSFGGLLASIKVDSTVSVGKYVTFYYNLISFV